MKVDTGRKNTDDSVIYKDSCNICKLDIGNQLFISDGPDFAIHVTCGLTKLLPQVKAML